MIRRLMRWKFERDGWKVDYDNIPSKDIKQCVILACPHTSNWDFLYMVIAFEKLGIPLRYTVKDELKKYPILSNILSSMGAIWINRRPKKEGEPRPKMVDVMADLFKEHEHLWVAVTPEGTRSLRKEWKTGYYYIAKKAGVPIVLGYLDYKDKMAGVGDVIYPGDDMEADLRRIMAFYNTKTAKHPKLFSVDERYLDSNR